MTKFKLAGYAGVALLGALVASSLALADSSSTTATDVSPLEAMCSASVINNSITWSASASGGVTPYSFLWSGDGNLAGNTSTAVTTSYGSNGTYAATVTVTDASSSVASAHCSAMVNYFVATSPTSTPTSTPPSHTTVNLPPTLEIGPNGGFLAHDMIVQSVGTNSFTGTIWGVTYTVNVASTTNGGPGRGPFPAIAFFLRGGNSGGAFDLGQLQVGDQLGVQGSVSTGAPLVVNATVVRDYSITVIRPKPQPEHPMFPSSTNYGNDHGNGNGSTTGDLQNRLNGFLQQLQSLRSLLNGHPGNR